MKIDSSYIFYIDWILLMLLFLSFCQQLFSKKFNMYGIISLISLSLYIAFHSAYNGVNALVLLLFVGAILLIILEMFLPGGIVGIVGISTLLIGLITVNSVTEKISFIVITSIISAVLLYLINVYLFKKKLLFLNRIVLEDMLTTDKGYVAKETDETLLGKTLLSITDLRPSGIAEINNEKYDVVTEGDFIEKGCSVEVTKVEGMRIVVRKI